MRMRFGMPWMRTTTAVTARTTSWTVYRIM